MKVCLNVKMLLLSLSLVGLGCSDEEVNRRGSHQGIDKVNSTDPKPLEADATKKQAAEQASTENVNLETIQQSSLEINGDDVKTPEVNEDIVQQEENTDASTDQEESDEKLKPLFFGEGLDILTGDRKSPCIGGKVDDFTFTPLEKGLSTISYISHKSELYSRLNVGFSLELGGIYQIVSGKFSNSVQVMKESSSNSHSVTAMASYRYETISKSVHQGQVKLTEESVELLNTNPLAFRAKCGDKFVSEKTYGGELYLIFSATQKESGKHDTVEVKTALEVFLAGLFNVSINNEVSKEDRSIINDLNITIECFNRGGSPKICAETGLETALISQSDEELRKMIQSSKVKLAQDIQDGKVVVLDEQYSYFPMPLDHAELQYRDVFFNTEHQSSAIRAWNNLREKVKVQCDSLGYYKDECKEAISKTEDSIKECAEQSQWSKEPCTEPDANEFNELFAVDMIGSVSVLNKYDEKTFNFNGQLDPGIESLLPNKIYNLRDHPYKFEDKATQVKTNLKEGWVIHLYEHPGAAGDKLTLEGNQDSYQDLGNLKYKVSSFMLEKK